MLITVEKITEVEEGDVLLYQVVFEEGFKVSVMNWGATLVEICTPDRDGFYDNVLVGYNDLTRYIDNPYYMGSTIGRTAGRIGESLWQRPSEDGKNEVVARLTANSGCHHIHGGKKGFSHRLWQVTTSRSGGEGTGEEEVCHLTLTLKSPDGDEGYPGNLDVRVTYKIHRNDKLEILYEAVSDKETLVNLTNHAYFNLSGKQAESILKHELMVDSYGTLELGPELVPTGRLLASVDTPFDFSSSKTLGARISDNHNQLILAGGYDHPQLLAQTSKEQVKARLFCPSSGRNMTLKTDQPCVVVYSMNFSSDEVMNSGKTAEARGAVCLECQNPPVSAQGTFADYSVVKQDAPYCRFIQLDFGILP